MLHDSRANSSFRHWVFYIAAVINGILFILCLPLSEVAQAFSSSEKSPSSAGLYLQDLKPRPYAKLQDPHSLHSNPSPAPTLHRTNNHPSSNHGLRILYRMVSLRRRPPDHVKGYGWSETQASLLSIPVSIGCLCGFFSRIYDRRKQALRRRQRKTSNPECLLFGLAIAAPALTVGLWWFTRTVPPTSRAYFIVPMLALVLIGFALKGFTYALTGYLAESYTMYAASGFAGLFLARSSICAAVLPIAHVHTICMPDLVLIMPHRYSLQSLPTSASHRGCFSGMARGFVRRACSRNTALRHIGNGK